MTTDPALFVGMYHGRSGVVLHKYPRSPLIKGLIEIQVSGLVEGLSVETGIFLGDHNVSAIGQRDYQ